MRVLIADQRPSVRAALRAVLEHDPVCEGIDEAVEARGALEALAFGADVLIVEWGLPGLSPAALLALAREHRAQIVIVALGRYTAARDWSLAAGADFYIDTTEPLPHFIGLVHDLCAFTGRRLAPAA